MISEWQLKIQTQKANRMQIIITAMVNESLQALIHVFLC